MMLRQTLSTVAMVLVTASLGYAAAPPDALVRSLTTVIRKHCPDAEIEMIDQTFVAKSGTMKFTVHARSKTGEIFPRTHEDEGPNFKGFLLRVSMHPGPYEGAAVVPQTLQGPYYPTFIDASPTSTGDGYLWVSFAYGSRLDAELKQALLEALPRMRFPGAKKSLTQPEP